MFPNWIYRILPFVYVVVGLAVVVKMDSTIAVASGVLLLIAGLLVLKMRADYRNQVRAAKDSRKGERQATLMGGRFHWKARWTSAFSAAVRPRRVGLRRSLNGRGCVETRLVDPSVVPDAEANGFGCRVPA
jgi:hypothetical protein